jgi:hypothetical protein
MSTEPLNSRLDVAALRIESSLPATVEGALFDVGVICSPTPASAGKAIVSTAAKRATVRHARVVTTAGF